MWRGRARDKAVATGTQRVTRGMSLPRGSGKFKFSFSFFSSFFLFLKSLGDAKRHNQILAA